MKKHRVLFLCTGNSIRSQMAEGYLRHLGGDRFEVWSAGVSPVEIHPMTYEALKEDDIDISKHRPKHVSEIQFEELDLIITLCGYARDICPTIPPQIATQHWPIDDPVHAFGGYEDRLQRFRATRDDIRSRVEELIERHPKNAG